MADVGLRTLTPVEQIGGLWWKREDLFAPFGVGGINGGKLRQCYRLIGNAVERGATSVITAASVHSPQVSAVGAVSKHFGVPCRIIVGGKPSTAKWHENIRIAMAYGAEMCYIKVAYNPMLQREAEALHSAIRGSYILPYGIAVHDPAPIEEIWGFHDLGAVQVLNLPDVETLIIPCGSAHSSASVLHGLRLHPEVAPRLKKVILVAVGPDRFGYLHSRLGKLQPGQRTLGLTRYGQPSLFDAEGDISVELDSTVSSRPGFDYGKTEKPRDCPIELHPRYEAKVWNYVNERRLKEAMDKGPTMFWIIGGAGKLEAMTP